MSSNVYQQFIDSQKMMFDEWRNSMKKGFLNNDASNAFASDPMESYNKMAESQRDFWKKSSESYKSYQAVFELWKKLSEKSSVMDNKAAMEVYDEWTRQNFNQIKKNLLPTMPEFVKEYAEKLVANMETSTASMSEHYKKWVEDGESLQEAFQKALTDGPRGNKEFLEVWQKQYEETFGKLMNAPTYGKDMEFWQQQKASYDRFLKYIMAMTQFYSSLFEIAQSATKKVLEEYADMSAQGTQPKSFEEFYKYWSKNVSDAYQHVLFSEEMSVLAGNMVDSMSRFKIEYDKLCEMYMSWMPIPKKSDMDDLYKTVYDLKKEVRALKKEKQANVSNSN